MVQPNSSFVRIIPMMGHGKGETATHISARLNRYRIVEALVKADITGTP